MSWVIDALWGWHLLAAVVVAAGWTAARRRKARSAETAGAGSGVVASGGAVPAPRGLARRGLFRGSGGGM